MLWLLTLACSKDVDTSDTPPSPSESQAQDSQPSGDSPKPSDTEPEGDRSPNVLVLSLDTLRRDALGRYGAGDDATPFLDSLLASGWALDDHRACSNWTYPGMICALSGLYNSESGFFPEGTMGTSLPALPKELRLLPDILTSQGYDSAFVGASPFFDGDLSTRYARSVSNSAWSGEEVLAASSDFFSAVAGGSAPWLMHLHFLDPHGPYIPPADYIDPTLQALLDQFDVDMLDQRVQQSESATFHGADPQRQELLMETFRALYRAEVRYLDDTLKRAFELWDELGYLDNTLVMIFSDHGEQFWEHWSFSHHVSMYSQETMAIGALWSKDMEPKAETLPTNHVDLTPWVLEQLGLTIPEEMTGLPVSGIDTDRPRYCASLNQQITSQAVDRHPWRLIYSWEGELELYNIPSDPEEGLNLIRDEAEVASELWELLSPRVELIDAIYTDYSPVDPFE